jgi:hypothetical protein
MHCTFLGPSLFFVISPLTQKLTHKPWPIVTITPIAHKITPGVVEANVGQKLVKGNILQVFTMSAPNQDRQATDNWVSP